VNVLDMLDEETGAKIRATVTTVLGVLVAIIAVLQATVGFLDALPDWEEIGGIALMLQAIITFLGRFTALGNKVIEP
jgi:hypothetical protein